MPHNLIIRPEKGGKELLLVIEGHPHASVDHVDLQHPSPWPDPEDGPPIACVLAGIAEQVEEYLRNPGRITQDLGKLRWHIQSKREPLVLELLAHATRYLFHDLKHRHNLHVQRHSSRLHPGNIQEIADQPVQAVRIALGNL